MYRHARTQMQRVEECKEKVEPFRVFVQLGSMRQFPESIVHGANANEWIEPMGQLSKGHLLFLPHTPFQIRSILLTTAIEGVAAVSNKQFLQLRV